MRVLFLIASLVLLATFAWPSMQRDPPLPEISLVSFEPVPLYEDRPADRRLGKLHFLGGWALRSNHAYFGGISALHVQGEEALALSDSGWEMRFPLPRSEGSVRAALRPIREGPGPSGKKISRDTEAMVLRGDTGWIAFEQSNAIWRYRRADWSAEGKSAPPIMKEWDDNRGPEAMVRLGDGRFLVFSEGSGGDSEVVLFSGDPALPGTQAMAMKYRPPGGFRITDAALLPDGRLLFLNRRARVFEGFTARLTIGRLPPLVPGAILTGEEVAAFEPPAVRENLEALSVVAEEGRTILWIASDDNYNGLQRTLLLKFALAL